MHWTNRSWSRWGLLMTRPSTVTSAMAKTSAAAHRGWNRRRDFSFRTAS